MTFSAPSRSLSPVPWEGSDVRPALSREEVLAYRRVIARLAKGRVFQEIPNEHPMHAAILIEAMFDNAVQDVRIFTGKLAMQTYDQPELVQAAKRFIDRPGSRLRVLIQHPMTRGDLEPSQLFQALKGTRAEFRTATGSYRDDDANHFAVMDDIAYRFELEHEHTRAIANFNDPENARNLVAVFDSAFSMGEPLA